MIQKLEAILIDMDGVLVDSEPVYLDFFRTFFARNGKQADPERLKKTVGASHKKTWQLLAEMWSPDCEPEKLCELYHNTCADLVLSYQRAAVPGLRQTLGLLQKILQELLLMTIKLFSLFYLLFNFLFNL